MLKKLTAALLVSCMLLQAPVDLAFASNGTDVQSVEAETEDAAAEAEPIEEEPSDQAEQVSDTASSALNQANTETEEEDTLVSENVDGSMSGNDDTVISGDIENNTEESEETEEPVDESPQMPDMDGTLIQNEINEKTESETQDITNTEHEKLDSEVNSETSADTPLPEETATNDSVTGKFDAGTAWENLLSMESVDEVDAYLSGLAEEELEALLTVADEEELLEFAEKLGVETEEVTDTPAKNYTEVGPLLPPVKTSLSRMRMSLLAEEEPENGLILSKTAEYQEESGTAVITLEAYTTGTVISSAESVPTDIVLVLDESGSMADNMYGYTPVYNLDRSQNYYIKRDNTYIQVTYCNGGLLIKQHDAGWWTGIHFLLHLGRIYEPMTSAADTDSGHVQFYTRNEVTVSKSEALKAAASEFAENVYDDALKNQVDHRISVIGFSGNNDAVTKIELEGDIRNNYSEVVDAINGLKTNGGTYIEDGLAKAESAFQNASQTSSDERNRVVVIFTDGIPGDGGWSNSTISGSANPAISSAYRLKNTYGATVYTIGMLDGADPELDISDDDNANDAAVRTNKFLHYLSSNYPQAQSMSDGGLGSNQGYYLAASDAASLTAIFEKISEEVGAPSISLGSDTVIKDVISPYFEGPAAGAVSAAVYDCVSYNEETGEAAWSDLGTAFNGISVAGGTIQVTGFDFNENFVSQDQKPETKDHGKKLVIQITVQPKEGFLGGNGVPTNDSSSGVYTSEGSLVEAFEQPTVDVPIKDITVTAEDKHVYLMADLSAEDLKSGSSITAGDSIKIDPSEENFGLESWQNAFVDISVSADPAAGYEDLTADRTYEVSCTIAPKSSGSENAKNGSGEGDILVYKPTVTFRDSKVWYGDAAPLNPAAYTEANYVDTVWKHNTETADAEKMTGTEPQLIFDYSLPEDAFTNGKVSTKEDIPVNVTAKLDNTDINQYTSFAYGACAEPDCGFNSASEEFLLHVNTCTLTIKKAGTDISDDPYVFTILKDGAVYTSASITGTGSITISELPVGTYTVVEDEGWSWRYESSMSPSDPVVLGSTNPDAGVVCTNTRDNDQWLNDYSAVAKNVYGESHESASEGGNN